MPAPDRLEDGKKRLPHDSGHQLSVLAELWTIRSGFHQPADRIIELPVELDERSRLPLCLVVRHALCGGAISGQPLLTRKEFPVKCILGDKLVMGSV